MADEDCERFSFWIRDSTRQINYATFELVPHLCQIMDKTSRTCSRNSAADSDFEFLSNLIRLIEFDTAEMRHMNQPFTREISRNVL